MYIVISRSVRRLRLAIEFGWNKMHVVRSAVLTVFTCVIESCSARKLWPKILFSFRISIKNALPPPAMSHFASNPPFLPFPGHHSPAMRHYSLFYLFFWRFWSSFIGQSVSRWPNLVNNNMIARRSHGTVVWNVTWVNDFGMVVAIIWRRIGMEAKIMCRDGRSEARKFTGGNMLATSVSVRQYPQIASAPKISSLY